MTVVYPVGTEIYAHLDGDWIGLMEYQFGVISARWGISNNGPIDFLAETGELRFNLQNVNGLFTPGSSGVISTNWKKGCLVKFEIGFNNTPSSSITKTFYGSITNIRPEVDDVNNGPSVSIIISDWMEKASKYPLNYPDIQLEKTSDEIVQAIIDLMPIAPLEQDFETGITTFPVVFDTITDFTKARTEFQKVLFSELCYLYVRHSEGGGEKLVLENRQTRLHKNLVTFPMPSDGSEFLLMETGDYLLLETGDFILLDSTLFSLNENHFVKYDIEYGKNIVNDVRFRYIPREYEAYGSTNDACWSSVIVPEPNAPPLITNYISQSSLAASEIRKVIFKYGYNNTVANPDPYGYFDKARGGIRKCLVSPPFPEFNAGDLKLWNSPEVAAGGTQITSITLSDFVAYSDRFEATFTNPNAQQAWMLSYLYIKPGSARIIVDPDVSSDPIQDSASILENDYQPIQFDMTYQVTDSVGTEFGNDLLSLHKNPRMVLNRIYLNANRSEYYMNAFIALDIGNMIQVTNEDKGIDGYFFINEMGFDYKPGKIIDYYFGVTENLTPVKNVSIVTGTSNAGTSITLSHTIRSGYSILIVQVILRGSESISSVVRKNPDGGADETLTLKSSKSFGATSADPRVELWYLLSPTPGTSNIIITASGASFIQAASMDFYNVNQTNPFGTVVSSSGTGGTPSVTVVGEDGDLIIDTIGVATGTITPDSSQDNLWNASSDGNWRGGGSSEAGAASVPMSWTLGGANKWALLGVALKRI